VGTPKTDGGSGSKKSPPPMGGELDCETPDREKLEEIVQPVNSLLERLRDGEGQKGTSRKQRMVDMREKMRGMGDRGKKMEPRRETKTRRGRKLLTAWEASKDQLQDREKPMLVIGSDVEALYPSLDDRKVAEICYRAVMETKMKFENIDYKEAVRYVALNWSAEQCRMSKLRRVLPWRTKNKGSRPGVTGGGPKGAERGDE
jgi:hypothetical protein